MSIIHRQTYARWVRLKDITVIGSGDFTHPRWFTVLQEKLEPAEPGLYRLKPALAARVDAQIPERCRASVRFMLTAEISSIYNRHGRLRKAHNLILAPSFSVVARINARLARIGNLQADGRPILGAWTAKSCCASHSRSPPRRCSSRRIPGRRTSRCSAPTPASIRARSASANSRRTSRSSRPACPRTRP